jgi:hypothetical protein
MSTSGSSQVELEENASFSSDQNNLIEEPSEAQPKIPIQKEPHHSGKVIHVPERWTEEIFDLISEHQEQDLTR